MRRYIPIAVLLFCVCLLFSGGYWTGQKPLKMALKQAEKRESALLDRWGQKEVTYRIALDEAEKQIASKKAELNASLEKIRVLKLKREEALRHAPIENTAELYDRFRALGYSPVPCDCR